LLLSWRLLESTVCGSSRAASTDVGSNLAISCRSPLPVFLSIITIPVEDRLGLSRTGRALCRRRSSSIFWHVPSCKPPYSLSIYIRSALQVTCTACSVHGQAGDSRATESSLIESHEEMSSGCLYRASLLESRVHIDTPTLEHLAEQRALSPSLCSMFDS
jgi:hypothetical protein